jgi:hypothetical protein
MAVSPHYLSSSYIIAVQFIRESDQNLLYSTHTSSRIPLGTKVTPYLPSTQQDNPETTFTNIVKDKLSLELKF